MDNNITDEKEMQDFVDDPEWIKNAEEKLPKDEEEYELEMYLSTDGKHTIHVKVSEPKSRKIAIKKAMEIYDYILARYGTKQAQAVKEYAKENGGEKISKESCKHVNMKFGQSRTEKNPGRWFKSCRDCGEFLGWQS